MLNMQSKSKLKRKVVKATGVAATALLVPGGIPLLVAYYIMKRRNRPEVPSA
jgi:hypothetical protein